MGCERTEMLMIEIVSQSSQKLPSGIHLIHLPSVSGRKKRIRDGC